MMNISRVIEEDPSPPKRKSSYKMQAKLSKQFMSGGKILDTEVFKVASRW